MKKRILPALLTICMIICTIPITAWAAEAGEDIIGSCGAETLESGVSNLTWNLNSEGTLTISGTGAMAD